MPRRAEGPIARSRTIGLVGHTGSGKTQLAEILLHAAGVVRAPGDVDQGTALLQDAPSARGRYAGRTPAWAWLAWDDAVVHLVDTPGIDTLGHPVRLALAGVDAAVLVVSAPDGLEPGAEDVLEEARHAERSLVVVVSKIDRGVTLGPLVDAISRRACRKAVALQLPLEEDGEVVGVVDVIGGVALRFDPDGSGAWSPEPVPTPLAGAVAAARERLHEAVALTDDALLARYLEDLELPADVVWDGLARAVADGALLPVLLASGTRHLGAAALLDALVRLVPGPEAVWTPPADGGRPPGFVVQWVGTHLDAEGERVSVVRVWSGEVPDNALWHGRGGTTRVRRLYQLRGPRRAVARTRGPGALLATWEHLPGQPGEAFTDGPTVPLEPPAPRPAVVRLGCRPVGRATAEGLAAAVDTLVLLDPSLRVAPRPGGGLVLAGTGRRQLDVAVEALRRRFGLEVEVTPPPVAFLEHPRGAVADVHGRHLRTRDGEVAAFGEVWIDLRPGDPTQDARVEVDLDDDVLPGRFVPAVEAGVRRGLAAGPTAGYPVAGVTVRCTGAEYDIFESTEAHFEEAGALAARTALARVGTVLLEPWSEVHLFLPGDEPGPLLAELRALRGRIVGLEVAEDATSIQALCPDPALPTLADRVESSTHGRGWFVVRPSHHEPLPAGFVASVVAASPYRDAAAVDAVPADAVTDGVGTA